MKIDGLLGWNGIFGMNANAGNVLVLQWYMGKYNWMEIMTETMLTIIDFS